MMKRCSLFLCTLSLLLAALPARSEVGVVVSVNDGETTRILPYELLALTDDADPFNTKVIWQAYSTSSATRYVLNPGGFANADGPPSLVVLDGTPVAAWARNSAQGFDLVVSSFDGDWSEPAILAGSASDEIDPVLAVDRAAQRVWLVYAVMDAVPYVAVRSTEAGLATWSDAAPVSLPQESGVRPSAVMHDGQLWIAYETVAESGSKTIVAGRFADGAFDGEIVGVSHYSGASRPRLHSDGARLWAEWVDADGELAFTWLGATGEWKDVRMETFDGVEAREYDARPRVKLAVQAAEE